jgi:hypothetical protein
MTAVQVTCADVLLFHASSQAVTRWLLFEYCSVLYAATYFSNEALGCVAAVVVVEMVLDVWVVLFVLVVQPAIDNEATITSAIIGNNFFIIQKGKKHSKD